ncbi:MAG: cupin-like domain-containing protein [Alphaproteobacteria bacterium]|nr:MAG: cupin-like domain-containing protein [Alphaproteobacteria bacterium]
MRTIPEYRGISAERFRSEIVPLGRPAVLRGAVENWPLVERGRASPAALVDYLSSFDSGLLVGTVTAPPQEGGRLFYREGERALNFNVSSEKLPSVLKGILKQMDSPAPWAVAMQGVSAADHLPGLQGENPIDLVPAGTGARLWIGNQVTVAPHFDVADNVACVAAGRRRFTLFPPDQLPNLYLGPFDVTPAGVPVSMVPLDDPDLERFPRHRDALEAAESAELEPGDAIFIPHMWWHGVQSQGAFNLLVNYWWNAGPVAAEHPYGALLHAAFLLYRDMPPGQRAIWRGMYDYYVFESHGDPLAHLPPELRSEARTVDPKAIAGLKSALAALLDEDEEGT